MRIGILGTFDVENYGDLLFPLVAERRLQTFFKEIRLDAISPVGGTTLFGDAVPSTSFEEFIRTLHCYDALLVGGGNIIHANASTLNRYMTGHVSSVAYADLWAGVTFANLYHAVPICWNAPGVSGAFPRRLTDVLRSAVSAADYLSVRDTASQQYIHELLPSAKVDVVPDTAWDINRLWTDDEIKAAYKKAFSTREREVPNGSLAVHVNSRYLGGKTLREVAEALDDLCRQKKSTAILLAIGQCHGDEILARDLSLLMDTAPLVVDLPTSLLEICACIAKSDAYIGSSLHGFITSVAFGRPAAIVASYSKVKFKGILESIRLGDAMYEDWTEAFTAVAGKAATGRMSSLIDIRDEQQAKLDVHWSRIATIIRESSSNRPERSRNVDSDIANQKIEFESYRFAVVNNAALELLEITRDQRVSSQSLRSEVRRQNVQIANLNEQIVEQNVQIANLNEQIVEMQIRSDQLRDALRRSRKAYRDITQSRSWRITTPLRVLTAKLKASSTFMRYIKRILAAREIFASKPEKQSEEAKSGFVGSIEHLHRRTKRLILSKEQKKILGNPRLHSSTFNAERPYQPIDAGTLANRIKYYSDERANSTSRRIAVFSANFGSYDGINQPEYLDPEFDYLLFIDKKIEQQRVWQVREPAFHSVDPTRTARYVKTHPHFLLHNYDFAVWVDANIVIRGDLRTLIDQFISSNLAIAAVPHPFRDSVYEEALECIWRKKDDAAVIAEQTERYDRDGFAGGEMIESGVLMFNLKHPDLPHFLATWWREIDRGSKRDQISFGYALDRCGIEYHPLTHRPNSIRNHPSFALLQHEKSARIEHADMSANDANQDPGRVEGCYSGIRDDRIRAARSIRTDVVVCVHNALEDVSACLMSIDAARISDLQRVIIVDDASDSPTSTYLVEFAGVRPYVELIRNERPNGYCKAANIGLGLSKAEFVILLNSDTIVTDGWAEKMADALFTTVGAGIVGPLSNAASHQSVPDHRSGGGNTAINKLPAGYQPEDMNRFCESKTPIGELPRVPLVHGFCMGVRREVFDAIGYFDEANFPRGYGEENDFCIRASDAGFDLIVATHTYVFHAKSKSYLSTDRLQLMKSGSQSLRKLHGAKRIERSVLSMESNPHLVRMRAAAGRLYRGR
ncbi:polysaccharide pyruvyl transferase family protein [Aurantimonas sp. A2-1-M11]|uniref:polysaccharide pyruvyl transferase family protein n=1 Tax=Aurantimonas sp. A2-1-M11 TaxID=3113712 RepID=UPI002F95BD1C